MFLGEHKHSLDDKGRLILPTRLRKLLDEGASEGRAVLAKQEDGCLAIYPEHEFEKRALEQLERERDGGAADRQLTRILGAGAHPFTADGQGRVSVPQQLREYAGLGRDVMLIGVVNRIEIWDEQRYHAYEEQGSAALRAAP